MVFVLLVWSYGIMPYTKLCWFSTTWASTEQMHRDDIRVERSINGTSIFEATAALTKIVRTAGYTFPSFHDSCCALSPSLCYVSLGFALFCCFCIISIWFSFDLLLYIISFLKVLGLVCWSRHFPRKSMSSACWRSRARHSVPIR